MPARAASFAGAFALAALATFAPSLARAGDDPCPQERPTDPGGYLGYVYDVTPSSFATPEGNGRVWYTTTGSHAVPTKSTRLDGVPDAVATVGEVLEHALAQYATMGYRPPLRDGDFPACASNGGDDRIDVYLVAFTGADGLTVTERCQAVTPKICPSFLLVDHAFAGYKTFTEGAQTVVPHELFHAVQNAYDTTIDRWFAEGSAQWATKQIYPDLVDLERNLPAFFSQVARPIDAAAGGAVAGYLYGSAIWPVFLGETHGPTIVQKIYDSIGASSGTVLDHTDQVLLAETTGKTTLADDFALFATWNAATGKRAGTGGYANAAKYPLIPTPAEFPDGIPAQVTGTTAGFSTRYFALHDPTPRKLVLTADETRLGGVVLPLEGGKARVDLAKALPTDVTGEAIVLLPGRSSKKTDVNYVLAATDLDAPDAAGDAGADAGDGGDAAPGDGNPGSGGGCSIARQSTHRDDARSPLFFGLAGLTLVLSAGGRSAGARRRWHRR